MGASNRELKTDIETLSAELKVAVPEGLEQFNNPRLVKALEALQAQKAGVAPQGGGVSVAPAANADDVDAAVVDVAPPPEADVAAPSAPPPAPDVPPEAAPAQPSKPQRYYVAPGRTLVANKGKLGAFQQVKAKDVAGGLEEIEALVASGVLVKSDRLLS